MSAARRKLKKREKILRRVVEGPGQAVSRPAAGTRWPPIKSWALVTRAGPNVFKAVCPHGALPPDESRLEMIEDIRKDHAKLAYRDAEGSLTTEAVVEFLNKTLGRIRRLRDISELREALRYFRKWKRWLISERRFYYFQDVSIPAAHFGGHLTRTGCMY